MSIQEDGLEPMLLAIGIDSFDTPLAGCTTHFTSILAYTLSIHGYRLADYPWLVRLNPAVPWKTRGNGATALLVSVDREDEARRVAEEVTSRLAKAYGSTGKESFVAILLYHADNLQDYITARPHCLVELYRRAVHELVPLKTAMNCLESIREDGKTKLIALHGSTHRGLVGALAALGADLITDHTFELIVYRKPRMWSEPRRIDEDSIIEFDLKTRPLTFLNYDYEQSKPLIAPHGFDPVLYGVRGEEPHILLKALKIIDVEEEPSHWTIFRTNQATNAHLQRKEIERVRPYDNAIVCGVIEDTKPIPGGHVIVRLCNNTCIDTAFYRETGRLRNHVLKLPRGTLVEVGGQVKPHTDKLTLNAEYLRILEPASLRAGGCTATIPSGRNVILYPPRAAFHHLMKPPERPLHPSKSLEPPSTPIHSDTISL
ncbi:TiaS agmantine-binding domain-containing protein [Hyperthermus butylicus]|uniref:tRNA(Ile2) 2-agmatinylcytidine synthetase TiaS n=1 Tax=Hyperthermus butylicus (strain DSM 5456 / JCM 9403 / PLM1-5) TaxID=415426 RepID=TIAS_HYPBU|nr:DUF1743 domain-containing protein [Hyperthermus butylicus]A2BIT1.1 RecName: Full=tRNA(Ile2) 2-agmatinylcytidine synthetase TiaS; Short=tRNA(Ile2)-agm2C synthetase; AltName: Full=tRNA(Ile2) agmatidine synthetase [Hyperthermus butylicus DSM 5456]ABM79887.1 nucleic acid binding protein with Zn ribbon domain - conserved archaeal protein [Hyperthermus butylicus DSM 5456]